MTIYRDQTDQFTSMTYSEGYDLGLSDAAEPFRLPRTTMPRTINASAGRFGYCDGFADGRQRFLNAKERGE